MTSMIKNFVYLIQGRAKEIPKIASLIKEEHADKFMLTFDEELDGSLFLPNCTWLEGRNHLLQMAKKKNQDYLYYIFLDDDIVFERGNFEVFESCLLKYQPAIAHPFYCKDYARYYRHFFRKLFPYPEATQDVFFDQMFVAIHKELIKDEIIVPYLEDFQHISWYSAGRYFDFMMNLFYSDFQVLRFNLCMVSNPLHETKSRPLLDYLPTLKSFLRQGTICSDDVFEACFNIERYCKYTISSRHKLLKLIHKVLHFSILRHFFWLIVACMDWIKEMIDFRKINPSGQHDNYSMLSRKYDLIIKNSRLDKSMLILQEKYNKIMKD